MNVSYIGSSLLDFRCYLECPALEILGHSRTENDIATLKKCEEKAAKIAHANDFDCAAFAEALYFYHRTIMHLSGNTITPLVINALTPAIIPFWIDYEQITGTEKALQQLSQFTSLLQNGDGETAALLLREGTENYKKERGYLA